MGIGADPAWGRGDQPPTPCIPWIPQHFLAMDEEEEKEKEEKEEENERKEEEEEK